MRDVNTITICKDDYNSIKEFEDAVKKVVMVLLDNNYVMTVRYDDKGLEIVAVDFNYDDQSYGSDYPYWLSPEEFEIIFEERRENENEGNCEY